MKTLLFSIMLLFFSVNYAQQDSYKLIIDGKEVWFSNTGKEINEPLESNQPILNLVTTNSPIYKVKKGDTYYSIAKKNKITVEKLYEINAISKNDILIPGTSLFLINKPNDTTSSFYHIINKGDTLYSLAKKYNTTVEKLILFNELNSNMISINQRLRVK